MDSRQPELFVSAQPQKLLKAKVQVCGRFLLKPDDDFGPEKAEDLVRRVAKDNARVRTSLTLFNTGLRLGENGLFASMPLEHIKYQRIAGCISPRQPMPQRFLALCTRDFDQKCVTILQFKEPSALADASRLIDKQRRLAAEEANYLPETPARKNSVSNWAMQSQQQREQRQLRTSSFSADSGFPGFGPLERGASQPTVMSQAEMHHQSPARERSTEARVTVRASSGSASVTDDVFYDRRQAAMHERDGRTIDSVIANYDDVNAGATYAVFESQNGPPTLLNERSVTNGQSSGGHSARPGSLRVQTSSGYDEVDRVDSGMRPQVTYVTNGHRSSGSQQQFPQQQLVQLQYSPPHQASSQLVKLVPVRPRIPHHHYVYVQQPQQRHNGRQYYALQPVSSRQGSLGRDYYQLVTK